MKQNLVDKVMQETILYGGLPARRCDVYHVALATLRTHIGRDNGGRPVTEADCKRAADRFAFLPPAVEAVPLTRTELEAICAS